MTGSACSPRPRSPRPRHRLPHRLYAIGAVLGVRLAPALLFGPFAGAFADRFNRRKQMVVCDLIRSALFASIIVGPHAAVAAGRVVPDRVRQPVLDPGQGGVGPEPGAPQQLEAANQISLVTTYGIGAVAAGLFALLSVLTRALGARQSVLPQRADQAGVRFDARDVPDLGADRLSLREITEHGAQARRTEATPSRPAWPGRSSRAGTFVGTTPMVRGLVVGILGAFAAGGAVVGVGQQFAEDLRRRRRGLRRAVRRRLRRPGARHAARPRLLRQLSPRRMFGIVDRRRRRRAGDRRRAAQPRPRRRRHRCRRLLRRAGLGDRLHPARRRGAGRHPRAHVRPRPVPGAVDLLLVLVGRAGHRGLIGNHQRGSGHGADPLRRGHVAAASSPGWSPSPSASPLTGRWTTGPGVSVRAELWAALRGEPARSARRSRTGLFVAFEGGEGGGKSTQVRLLTELAAGAGPRGGRSPASRAAPRSAPGCARCCSTARPTGLSPRAEALLYAADRAEHVDSVVLPGAASAARSW